MQDLTDPAEPMSGTYHEVKVHEDKVKVEIEPGETGIVKTWLETWSPSQPSDELDMEEFPPPHEPTQSRRRIACNRHGLRRRDRNGPPATRT